MTCKLVNIVFIPRCVPDTVYSIKDSQISPYSVRKKTKLLCSTVIAHKPLIPAQVWRLFHQRKLPKTPYLTARFES